MPEQEGDEPGAGTWGVGASLEESSAPSSAASPPGTNGDGAIGHSCGGTTHDSTRESMPRRVLAAYALLVSGLAGLLSGGHTYSIDDEIKFQTTRSLLHLRPEIPHQAGVFPELYSARPNGTYVGVYTLGQSLIGLPFYIVGRVFAFLGEQPGTEFTIRAATFLANSYVLAALAVLLVVVAVELGATARGAFALSTVYVFGTYALPHAKTFSPELGSALCLLGAFYLTVRASRSGTIHLVFWCGVVAGSATLFRSNAPAYLAPLAVYLLVALWRRGAKSVCAAILAGIAGLAVPGTFIALTNIWRFDDPLGAASYPAGYPILEGLQGLLLSPGKSIFLYAPAAALSLLAILVVGKARNRETALCLAIVATNLFVVGRVPFWSGDAAWGPRYLQETLPILLLPLAFVADRVVWRRTLRWLGTLGFFIAALPAVIVYFNAFLIRGAAESGEPDIAGASHWGMEWNPILSEIELMPEALRDVLGADRPNEPDRGQYLFDPIYDYGYFGGEPRVDFWWLWVGPTDASSVTYLLLLPLLAQLACGAWLAGEASPRTRLARGSWALVARA
jgi:hypothetical protein